MKKQKLSYRDISTVCLELSLLMHAGELTGSAFETLSESVESSSLSKMFLHMGRQADEGVALSDIFEKSGVFPKDVCSMLRVGEKTGKSEETLAALSRYYDRLDIVDGQMRSAVLYPSVLLFVMMLVVVLLLAYVLPVFNDVYLSLGKGLTGAAAVLLSIGNGLADAMPILCVIAVVVVLDVFFFSCSQSFRSRILGVNGSSDRGISGRIHTARFAGALSMGISSGLSLEESIEKAADLLSSPRSMERCRLCISKMSDGTSFGDALMQCRLLPAAECRLLSFGIKAGIADAVAQEVARRMERDADTALDNSVSSIEPVMIIVSSLLIGVILLSVMLPLTNIMSSIG